MTDPQFLDPNSYRDLIESLDGANVGRGARLSQAAFDERATQLEAFTGQNLPADYRAFVRACGCYGVSAHVVTRGETLPLSVFFGFESGDAYDLEWNARTFAGRVPSGALPIAIDDGGSLFLLDLQSGKVSAWEHETESARAVADSFAAFLSMLESDDEDDE